MGSLTGSKSKSSGLETIFEKLFSQTNQNGEGTKSSSQNPWAAQDPYLKQGFQTASDFLKGSPSQYNGEMAAPTSDVFTNALKQAGSASGNGSGIIGTLTSLFNKGAGDGDASRSGYMDAMKRSQADSIGNANTAGLAAANSDVTRGLIDSASSAVTRNLSESTLPGINRSAVASGNMNSSRAGVADGIARRGAAESIGNIGAGISSQAFDRAYGSSLDENSRSIGNIMNASTGLADSYKTALGAGSAANDMGLGNAERMAQLGLADTADKQRGVDGTFAKFMTNLGLPWQNLQNYMGTVGGNNWGGQSSESYKDTGLSTTNTTTDGTKKSKNKSSGWGFGLSI